MHIGFGPPSLPPYDEWVKKFVGEHPEVAAKLKAHPELLAEANTGFQDLYNHLGGLIKGSQQGNMLALKIGLGMTGAAVLGPVVGGIAAKAAGSAVDGSTGTGGDIPYDASSDGTNTNPLPGSSTGGGAGDTNVSGFTDYLKKLGIDPGKIASFVTGNGGLNALGIAQGVNAAVLGKQATDYGKQGLTAVQDSYNQRAPLRVAGLQGMLNPQTNDLSALTAHSGPYGKGLPPIRPAGMYSGAAAPDGPPPPPGFDPANPGQSIPLPGHARPVPALAPVSAFGSQFQGPARNL